MVKVIKAPAPLENGTSVYLAGSIGMGSAGNWQTRVEQALSESDRNFLIFNPRRDDWDSSWTQDISNLQFKEQVEWELSAMEQASIIAMYFDPSTKSPISLLELGLFARTGKLIVCCPTGFWRKGNVDILCKRYGVKQVESIQELVHTIDRNLKILLVESMFERTDWKTKGER